MWEGSAVYARLEFLNFHTEQLQSITVSVEPLLLIF